MSPSDPLMKVVDVQARLGLGGTATRALISSGAIPSLRVGPGGRSIRIRSETLEKWVQDQEQASDEGTAEGSTPLAVLNGGTLHRAQRQSRP
jgi:excisionase family DNA binding protein